jgi:cytochrome c biogenesis factor
LVTPVHRVLAHCSCSVGFLLVIERKKGTGQQVSPYALLGITFIILGIVFGSDRLIGYAFLGAGVLIAVFDAVKNRQKK